MSIVIPFSARAKIANHLGKRPAPSNDCQGERPFLVVRAKANDVIESIRLAADEEKRLGRIRMQADARRDCILSKSHAQTAAWLRSLANLIEAEGSDAS